MKKSALLYTVEEVADLLRMTKAATFAAIERGQVPGVVKLGRRVRVRCVDLHKMLGLPLPSDSPKG